MEAMSVPGDEVPVWLTCPTESLIRRSFVEKYANALHDYNNSKGKPMISVKLLHPAAKLPTRSYHSAGYDLYACEEIDCKPGSVTMVPIGIATSFPAGHAALVWDRSGMGKKGLTVFGGVIDEDYRGQWFVMLYNSTSDVYEVHIGDRVAQFVLQEVKQVPIAVAEELTDTLRGENGFSSTGK
jgi:dUTP pyrophosphatase